jgi:TatD DNase family protein
MRKVPADMAPLIDTHAHLDQVADVERALERAHSAGVSAIVAVGMNLLSSWEVLKLAKMHSGFVYVALGMHPWAVEEAELEEICRLVEANVDTCVAIGEVGLDSWIKKDMDLQHRVLRTLLRIAAAYDKPLITHSRGSYEDVFQMVKEHNIKHAVFHWYSGPLEIVEQIIESGYFISATPAVEYSKKHRAVIERVPLENLLLETDCPVKYRGIASEPASIQVTLREVAKLKELEPAVIAQTTTENAVRLFRL